MDKFKFLVAIVLFFTSTVLFAQRPEGGQMEIPSNGLITGKVVDEQGNAVEYATISLVSLRDSSIVSGAISDIEGKFKMADIKLGAYCMKIKVLGYETKEVQPIYLMPKGRGKGEGTEQDFGNIALGNSDVKLDDVTIVGEKSRVQYKIDKKVINPAQDINASSGTAVEILQNTPSINVDIDGNVELRGSSNFTVLIDGKPTTLTGSEALQQIPANMVENIEIITNPSAKFDPDGAAGIINVILKKKVSLGLTGIVNVSVGTNDKYKGNVTLAYKINKIGFNIGIDYRDEKRYGTGKEENEDYGRDSITNQIDTINYRYYDGNRDMHMIGLGLTGGLDFYLNDKNTLSISGRYNDRDFSHTQDAYYHKWTNPATIDDYYLLHSESGFGGTSYNLNLDYNLKFRKPEQKLDFSFSYSNRDGLRKNDQYEYITDDAKNIIDNNPQMKRSHQSGPEDDYRYKVDFVSPLGQNGMFEAGYQGRYEIEDEDYIASNYNYLTGMWEVNNSISNSATFTDNIQAFYSTYANKIYGFDYKIGLRSEYNKRILDQLDSHFDYQKLDFFPSAYITRQLKNNQQIQLNYSRRVNRPGGRELNPFRDESNPDEPRKGNPELEPEYIDSYELNYQKQIKKSFISFESFFRRTNNKISDKTVPEENNVKLHTYANLKFDNSIGVEFNANMFITSWWRLNASGSAFYYKVEDDYTTKESFNYNLRFDNSFTFKSGTKIQLTGFYSGPSATIQGTQKAMFYTNFAIKQDLLKGKLTLTGQLQDVFGSMGWKFTEETESYYRNVDFQREPRVVTFSVTYRLNNFKQKKNGERADDSDIEMGM